MKVATSIIMASDSQNKEKETRDSLQ
jgi:hypothetical protein